MSQETTPTIENATDTMKSLITALVPPDEIEISDIFGDTHNLPATCSARSQIKIMRILEKIKDVELPEGVSLQALDVGSIVKLLGSLVTNDVVFEAVCQCAELAHPRLIKKLVARAEAEEYEYDPELPVADLFPIEEAIAMIVPLFLRIARRGGQAISKIAEVSES